MTKYEVLKQDMVAALRSGEKLKRRTIGDILSTIDKNATSGKMRIQITDDFVDETLRKYEKTIQEQVDTCPKTERYASLLQEYEDKLAVVRLYAPKTISDPAEIRALLSAHLPDGRKFSNMGEGMRFIKANHCDARVAQPIVKEFI